MFSSLTTPPPLLATNNGGLRKGLSATAVYQPKFGHTDHATTLSCHIQVFTPPFCDRGRENRGWDNSLGYDISAPEPLTGPYHWWKHAPLRIRITTVGSAAM